ncbi:hypothetical protein [Spirillospora sp. NBC_01491]|uniref:hypothetical protein n=1 Tax=Spirillospora sp. NBC_01491 TaxID=2976007 RepID=UPI002E358267|nr:hypothetical protein [Spirillospora sp. NBC_01491]
MASISVGSVSIEVVPSVRDFAGKVRAEILPEATRIGREAGRRIQEGIEKAVKPVRISVNMGQALTRLERLKTLLGEIDGRTVNVQVNVDVGGSIAELRALAQLLNRLDGRRINVNINTQVAEAMTQIAALQAQIRALQRRHGVNIDVDIGAALASIFSLKAALIGLGVTSLPAIAGIGAGVIGLVGPLAAAGAGFAGLGAVAIPAITRIRQATQQQAQASQAAAGAAGQAQQRAFAQAAAQQQLASAIRNAAYTHKQALEQVRTAEMDLTQAQQAARSAQLELNRARGEARRQLQDISNQVASARLAERDAVFGVQDAEAALAKLRADPKATQGQIARQQLAVDQAKQQLKEQQLALRRLVQDEKAAKKAGVEGSDQVRSARERLADANAKISESERALAAARANVARVDQQSAEQVASARRALAQASMQAASGASAMAGPMVQLTALEQQLATAWKGLTGAFNDWAKSLQPDVIPVLIKGISLLKGLLPSFTPLVKGAAAGVSELLDRASAAAKSPFWTQFSTFMGQSAGPAIVALGTLAGNLLKAFAGIAQGFMPIGMAFLQVLSAVAAKFAAFTTGLANNPAFQRFVDQFTTSVPLLIDTFSAIGSLVGSLFAALAPAMAPVLGFIRTLAATLAGVLKAVAPAIQSVFATLGPALGAVIAVLGPVVAQLVQALAPLLVQLITGLKPILLALVPVLGQIIAGLAPVISALLSGLQPAIQLLVPVVSLLVDAIAKILFALAPVLPLLGQFIASLVAGLMPVLTPIVGAIALLAQQIAGQLIAALQQSAPALLQMVTAIAGLLPALLPLVPLWGQWFAAILPLVPVIIQLAAVIVQALVPIVRILIQAMVLYWTTIMSLVLPVLRLMVTVVTWVASMLMPIIAAIGVAIRWLGTVAMWLWTNAIKPAFTAIAKIAQWLFTFVAVVLIAPFILAFKALGAIAKWLWQSVIGPVFRGIGAVIRSVYNTLIKPVITAFRNAIRTYLAPAMQWLWNSVIKPVWGWIGDHVRSVYNTLLKPTIDKLKSAVGSLGNAFDGAVKAIGRQWDKLKDVAKKPVAFVVNTVFNKGIVRLWNSVAKLVPGTKTMDEIHGFARGGIFPGYTPGRDIGLAAVSGGEAIMRPEFTRAVGSDFIATANHQARVGGPTAVMKWLAGAGDPGGVPWAGAYSLGGIVGGFAKAAKGFFAGGLMKTAKSAFGPLLSMADQSLGGTPFGRLAAAIPHAIVERVLGAFKGFEKKLGGGGAIGVVRAARSQIGRPYSWGGGGKGGPSYGIGRGANTFGFDCSGLTEYAWWKGAHKSIGGVTNPQWANSHPIPGPRPGALAFPSGPSVHVMLGSDRPGYIIQAPYTGSYVQEVKRTSGNWRWPNSATFDNGGYLPTGVSMVYNGTGSPEPVLTDAQWDKVAGGTVGGDGGTHYHGHFDGLTKAAYEAQFRTAMQAESVLAAQKDRTGRRR